MEAIINFIKGLPQMAVDFYNDKILVFYDTVLVPFYKQYAVAYLPFLENVKLWWILAGIGGLILLILLILMFTAGKRKKRKVKFYVDGELTETVKVKYKKPIEFAVVPKKDGYKFVCWCVDEDLTTPYEKEYLDRKKALNLYAKYEKLEEEKPVEQSAPQNVQVEVQTPVVPSEPVISVAPTVPVEPVISVAPSYEAPVSITPVAPVYEESAPSVKEVEPVAYKYEEPVAVTPVAPAYEEPVVEFEEPVVPVVVQEPETKVNTSVEVELLNFDVEDDELSTQYIYDELRYAMLCYERATQFKKLGVVRKQSIAEMFEKDGEVNLYLNVDPKFMQEKGYDVEEHDDKRFSPCKLVVKTKQDLEVALKLINEAMTVNNLVKSDVTYAQKPASTEAVRKSGFAFFVKNETVATTVEDYYRLLRAIVLSYEKTENTRLLNGFKDKMILKIFKKGENINVYLALDKIVEPLKDVSYDRNFVETPALIEVRTAEDLAVANEFIDKLMYLYGMIRNPEKAEISMDDQIEKNCGFGYRIKN